MKYSFYMMNFARLIQKKECLRHVSIVPELSFTNTQISEQLNRKFGRCNYFVDKMDGAMYSFSLRLLMHLNNVKINTQSKSD